MQKLSYYLFRALKFGFSLVPFWKLYLFSDFLYFMLYYVIGYRKKVVYANLKNSFPEKSEIEIKKMAKKFYSNLSDITLESIKGMTLSKKTLLKRYKVVNVEIADDYFNDGKNIILVAAHYTNWEWAVVSFGFQFAHKSIGLYKKLSNKYVDKYLLESRAVGGMYLVSINETYKTFETKFEKPAMFIMAADQSPSNLKKAIWLKFLNQDTPFIHGPEFYAKHYNFPVLMADFIRIKRGYYEIKLSVLEDKPQDTKDGEITEKYRDALERLILPEPENWLWSHKRWKHKR